MNTPTCKNCVHFHQHYVLDDQSCCKVYCGHCVRPRIKHRSPDGKVCSYFGARTEPAPIPDRKGTVQFLTTKMLDYILSLDLPPDVE